MARSTVGGMEREARTFAIAEIVTPALLVDRDKLARNLDRMANRAGELGVSLRPHLKTAKSAVIADMAAERGAVGVTVSTVKEAEYFSDRGVTDILYAVGIVPDKLDRLAALIDAGATIQIICDDPRVASATAARAGRLGTEFDVLIEIDTDGHRAGLAPHDPTVVETGRIIDAASHLRLVGVLTHAGDSYLCRSAAELERHAELERSGCVAAAEHLQDDGLPCPVVSVGSTPTALAAAHLEGVTELRAGVYMFMDLYQAGLGVCSIDDIALSVAATVIGHNRSSGKVIVDAGGLALSKDRGTATMPDDYGYGLVRSAGGEPIGALVVNDVNQEHGMIEVPEATLDVLPPGAKVRILPNHACMTAAAHDEYLVTEGCEVVDRWDRVNGW